MLHSTIEPSADHHPIWSDDAFSSNGVRSLAAYSPLFREGDPATHFYEVLDGCVRAFKIFPDGRRQIVSFAFAGDIVGFGHGDHYRFDCDTIAATRLRAIHKSSLLRAMHDRPDLGEKLLEIAADEVTNMRDLSILLCRKTAVERIASFLLSMTKRNEAAASDGRRSLPMCRADIADFLGLTIETVSRTLTKLRALRVIDLPDRAGFVVRDMHRLQLLAQCDDNTGH
ncbi:helix-turn-helix domain-containing protein [Devosia rhodophyticola]|uniref:Helix-turn-helix domain-containing protein n=1 Tax=Devosia rhodophyticola TaxID=3026423 RepID=A0ABY7YYH9_9HYPH|nr:helix-turn-helix domain-containing protein [Devosia rhodophyticola]WDR06287.1 helix-turn-helix domain-containing protein [Devosia rhodophyticola]